MKKPAELLARYDMAVEFRRTGLTARDGEYRIIDINGRTFARGASKAQAVRNGSEKLERLIEDGRI